MAEFVFTLVRDTATVPVIVSLCVAGAMTILPLTRRYAGVSSLIGAFAAGWFWMPWTRWIPKQTRDWLIYVAIVAAAGGFIAASKLRRRYQVAGVVIAAVATAVVGVPDFRNMVPARPVALAMVAGGSMLMALAFEFLLDRLSLVARVLTWMLAGTTVATVMAQSAILNYAQVGGMLSAGLTGILAIALIRPAIGAAGASVVLFSVLSNLTFLGYASSTARVPLFCYPVAVFGAILVGTGLPATGESGRATTATLVPAALLMTVFGFVIYTALMASPPWEAEV